MRKKDQHKTNLMVEPLDDITFIYVDPSEKVNAGGQRLDDDFEEYAMEDDSEDEDGESGLKDGSEKSKTSSYDRLNHNEIEKNRRAQIKISLEKLMTLVPTGRDIYKHTTAGLLIKSRLFIESFSYLKERRSDLSLRKKEKKQRDLKQQLQKDQKILRKRLQQLQYNTNCDEIKNANFTSANINLTSANASLTSANAIVKLRLSSNPLQSNILPHILKRRLHNSSSTSTVPKSQCVVSSDDSTNPLREIAIVPELYKEEEFTNESVCFIIEDVFVGHLGCKNSSEPVTWCRRK